MSISSVGTKRAVADLYSGLDRPAPSTLSTLSSMLQRPTSNPKKRPFSEALPSPSFPPSTRMGTSTRSSIGSGERTGRMWGQTSVKVSCAVEREFPSIADMVGIDLNTNWGYQWQAPEGTSACSDAYQGSEAFEAYETRAVADYLANGTEWKRHKHEQEKVRKVRAFVDLHSYGQLCESPLHPL